MDKERQGAKFKEQLEQRKREKTELEELNHATDGIKPSEEIEFDMEDQESAVVEPVRQRKAGRKRDVEMTEL